MSLVPLVPNDGSGFFFSPTVTKYINKPDSHVALVVKNLPVSSGNLRDTGSTPGSGKSSGGR